MNKKVPTHQPSEHDMTPAIIDERADIDGSENAGRDEGGMGFGFNPWAIMGYGRMAEKELQTCKEA